MDFVPQRELCAHIHRPAGSGMVHDKYAGVTVDRRGRELHFVLNYRTDTEKDDLQ